MANENPRRSPDSGEQILRQTAFLLKWLKKLAAAFRVELVEATQKVYLETFLRFPPEKLESAFVRTIEEWDRPSMFPPPSFILQRLENNELAAEQSWQSMLLICRKFWHPDIGFDPACPEIGPVAEYALRQIGGLQRIFNATNENIDFVRKGFIQSCQRFREEGGEQLKLSTAQAQKALETIRENRKQLASTEHAEVLPADPKEPAATGRVREIRQLSPQEHDAKVAELKRQARSLGVET